jgi:Tol biopolymer transport system component
LLYLSDIDSPYPNDHHLHLLAVAGLVDTVIARSDKRPQWSPDGNSVAYFNAGGVRIRRLPFESDEELLSGFFDSFDWAAGGSRIIATGGGILESMDLAPRHYEYVGPYGDLTATYSDHEGLALSPDGRKVGLLYTWGPANGPSILDIATRHVTVLAASNRMVTRMAWAADGTRVAFVRCGGPISAPIGNDLVVADADGAIITTIARDGIDPAWSPDGRQVAFATYRDPDGDGRVRTELAIVNSDGSGERRLTNNGDSGVVQDPDWSPDGDWIAFAFSDEGS